LYDPTARTKPRRMFYDIRGRNVDPMQPDLPIGVYFDR
jgi:hypothetical protein